jgi:hypothetical protein
VEGPSWAASSADAADRSLAVLKDVSETELFHLCRAGGLAFCRTGAEINCKHDPACPAGSAMIELSFLLQLVLGNAA